MVLVTVNSAVFYVLVLLSMLVICNPLSLNGKWQEHDRYCESFKCRDARPRIFKSKDLFPDLPFPVSPPRTLLHRCDDSAGYCSLNACALKKSENVTLVFAKPLSSGALEYLVRVALNHTLCSCRNPPSRTLPK